MDGDALTAIWDQGAPHHVPHGLYVTGVAAFDKAAEVLLDNQADQLTAACHAAPCCPILCNDLDYHLPKWRG